jgi:hypothetical protein
MNEGVFLMKCTGKKNIKTEEKELRTALKRKCGNGETITSATNFT